MIKAQIIQDSISEEGNRITTYVLTYPRIIHSELMTHRVFSRNSASSRAIPFEKMVKMVEENPFTPMAWQKSHKGMQGSEYITDKLEILNCENMWLLARDQAVDSAKRLHSVSNVTKQLCNRLLEPFLYHTVILTATDFEGFFNLRCPQHDLGDGKFHKSKEDALQYVKEVMGLDILDGLFLTKLDWLNSNKGQSEIHMMDLSEKMYDAYNQSVPRVLAEGQWHIPFGDNIHIDGVQGIRFTLQDGSTKYCEAKWVTDEKIKIATARCARISYGTFEGKIDYEADIRLHDRLIKSGHYSPTEHCALNQGDSKYYANFKGWKQYRTLLEGK